MSWELQSFLWRFFPADRAVSFSVCVFGLGLGLCVVVFIAGRLFKRRWWSRGSLTFAVIILTLWGGLFATRPPWLILATQPIVPTPRVSVLHWKTQSPGLETAELNRSRLQLQRTAGEAGVRSARSVHRVREHAPERPTKHAGMLQQQAGPV
jgi:hypothetical protein